MRTTRSTAARAAVTAAGGAARFAGEVVSPAIEEAGRNLVPVARTVPGIARVTGSTALHAGIWGARASVHTGIRLARAAVDGDERVALAQDASDLVEVVTEVVRAVMPVSDVEPEVVRPTPDPAAGPGAADAAGSTRVAGGAAAAAGGTGTADGERIHERGHERVHLERLHGGWARRTVIPDDSPEALRRRGAELLERSRDVWTPQVGHPAYSRILDELAPDEARILLHLVEAGPQPSVDVRTGGLRSGTLIASGLSMIGARSGVRFTERVPAYLNNLARLGLVWFSKEPVRDPMEYQVLEAQPEVLAALHSATFAKVVRRSIQLTPFGVGFCKACLVTDASARFPAHDTPSPEGSTEPPNS